MNSASGRPGPWPEMRRRRPASAVLIATGSPENVIIIRQGSQTEMQSGVTKEAFQIIQTLPGIARDRDGKPLASAEIAVIVNLPRRETGQAYQPSERVVHVAMEQPGGGHRDEERRRRGGRRRAVTQAPVATQPLDGARVQSGQPSR